VHKLVYRRFDWQSIMGRPRLILVLLTIMTLASGCTPSAGHADPTPAAPTLIPTQSQPPIQLYGAGDGTTADPPQVPTSLPLSQRPPPKPCGIGDSLPSATVAAAPTPAAAPDLTRSPRNMKILVISADSKETDFPALTAYLDRLGIPYETLIATQTTLTSSILWDGVSYGCYQGIILTTGNLTHFDDATQAWKSAFSNDEWMALWNYETMFGVRQVTSYTYPGWPDSYGLNYMTYQDTISTTLHANLTPDGQQIFPYLNASNPIAIRNARVYLATVAISETANVTPLLTLDNPNGSPYVIAAIKRYADGRENLAVMAENNPNLVHSLLLSYGIVNWLTKGLFLGERQVAMDIQPDDIFIGNTTWDIGALLDTTGHNYRMTGDDVKALIDWQNSIRSRFPVAADLTLEMPFVGAGASGLYKPDTLTPALLANQASFNWINHTYNHANLDKITAEATTTVLQLNDDFARTSGFSVYTKDAMVQPDISGLDNANFQRAAYAFGIRYLISDTSRPGWNNPSPNTGFYSPHQPGLLIIPRHATALFYNVRTPDEWVSEYNCYYGPQATCANGTRKYWPHNLSYAEILDKESDKWVQHLLKWDIDPLMFHQPNLGTYDGVHSLLGDLVEATLTKYSAMYTLPILNLTQHDIGVRMANRMAYNTAGVTATLYPGEQITLTSGAAAVIPLTGITYGDNSTTYGGQTISYLTMNANQTISMPVR
jgi:hypothetical protein